MRKPIIAGNWKMNKTPEEAAQLVTDLIPLVKDAQCDVVVCTPAVDFAAIKPIIAGTNIKLGAQNVHFKASGAYTGELSADMLKAAGCEYVIIGHSERRQYFGETDKTVNLRTVAAVNHFDIEKFYILVCLLLILAFLHYFLILIAQKLIHY